MVETIFVAEELAQDYEGVAVEVVVVVDHVLDKIATTRTPQGVVAVARQQVTPLNEVVGRGFVLALDRIADPGNAGTVIRTADAFGAAGVVLTEGSVDPFNPKVVRASTGSITRLPLVVGAELTDLFDACDDRGQRVIALDASAERAIDEPGLLEPPVTLLFGSEAHGLDAETRDRAAAVVAIRRYGGAESLNLSVAVGVAAHVAARITHGTRSSS